MISSRGPSSLTPFPYLWYGTPYFLGGGGYGRGAQATHVFRPVRSRGTVLGIPDRRGGARGSLNEAWLPGGRKNSGGTGIGGAETPESAAATRLDSLLDLRFDRLKESILVDGRNLEVIYEKLAVRRTFFESLPSLWPTRGLLTSGFGVRVSPFTDTKVFHHGLDIDGPKGSPVRAAGGGKVIRCGFESLYGNIVVVDHGNGYGTFSRPPSVWKG